MRPTVKLGITGVPVAVVSIDSVCAGVSDRVSLTIVDEILCVLFGVPLPFLFTGSVSSAVGGSVGDKDSFSVVLTDVDIDVSVPDSLGPTPPPPPPIVESSASVGVEVTVGDVVDVGDAVD